MTKRTRAQLQHEIHRLRRERDALTGDFEGRPVLVRIALLLATLREYGDPTPAAKPFTSTPPTTRKGWSQPEPGAATRKWRNMERRHLRRLNTLANDLEADVTGFRVDSPVSKDERTDLARKNSRRKGYVKRCPKCGRSGRAGAETCDRMLCEGAVLQ